jgi:hypothetical protein
MDKPQAYPTGREHFICRWFRRGMLTAAAGLAVGLLPAYRLARLMRATVFGVSAAGPAVLLWVPLALTGAAALAIYIPARR